MGSVARTDGWTDGWTRGMMTGRVGSMMMMGASLSRVRTRYVYTSVDLGLVHLRARERASELDDDDAMTIPRSGGDGWMDGRRRRGRFIHPSIHRSIVRWMGPAGLARVARASRVVDETHRSRCLDR